MLLVFRNTTNVRNYYIAKILLVLSHLIRFAALSTFPLQGKAFVLLAGILQFFSWDTLHGNFCKVNNLDTKLPKGLPPEKREAFGCYQSMELLAKKRSI